MSENRIPNPEEQTETILDAARETDIGRLFDWATRFNDAVGVDLGRQGRLIGS